MKRFGEGRGVLWTRREIRYQCSFYLEHFKTVTRNSGKLFGDVDVNVKWVKLAILDKNSGLRGMRTFWFKETLRWAAQGKGLDGVVLLASEKLPVVDFFSAFNYFTYCTCI